MVKQIGLLKITGTIDGICFYLIDGVYYARQKSSLSGERVKHDPAFAGTMRCAKSMGSASKIASVLYRQIVPPHERSRDKFREVVSMVRRGVITDEHDEDRLIESATDGHDEDRLIKPATDGHDERRFIRLATDGRDERRLIRLVTNLPDGRLVSAMEWT